MREHLNLASMTTFRASFGVARYAAIMGSFAAGRDRFGITATRQRFHSSAADFIVSAVVVISGLRRRSAYHAAAAAVAQG